MKNILFTNSYFLRLDTKQWSAGIAYPPLGTLYAAAVMRNKGYKVSFHDVSFDNGAEAILPELNQRPDYFVIYDDGFNYLTKMCLTNMREAAYKMIELGKAIECKVIISSSDSTDRYEEYLNKGADFVLIGEGEDTLAELIDFLEKEETNFKQISGIAYKDGSAVIKTARRNVIKNLDELPFPAWDLIDIDTYRSRWLKKTGYFSINIGTTRGCPYKCNWCAKPIYGNRYNARSPQNVIDELLLLKDKTSFDHVWFCDDIFGLKPGWVNEFAKLTEVNGLRFKFKIQSRADLLLQENYIEDLAKAGCDNVWMGAESGSQKILDAMDKGTTIEQIRKATFLLKKHHIKPSFFIQFGYPGETKEDIKLTIKMINSLLPHEIGISVSYPLPGTIFYEKVKLDLKDKTNWTDSDDLALLYKGSYKPGYYKKLHRYVHISFKKHLALNQLADLLKNPINISVDGMKKVLSCIYYIPLALFKKIRLKYEE
jgi:anaerobic magnesium-protoporphyrin IX monomethyl ester cyclase